MADLPNAIDKWELNIKTYEERTTEQFPECMKMPVLMQMIPVKSLEQVLYKYRMNPEKDYLRFSRQLVEFSNEMRYEARRGGGDHMDVDAFAKEGKGESPDTGSDYYSEDQWDLYKHDCESRVNALTEELNWMGKGGKGAKGGGKGSKGGGKGGKGGKSDNCLWCDKPGHYKKDCRAFVKWKEDKDEERKNI